MTHSAAADWEPQAMGAVERRRAALWNVCVLIDS